MSTIPLQFEQLRFRPWVLNAKIFLDNGYTISVSKTDEDVAKAHPQESWHTGADNSFQVAIMAYGELVLLEQITGDNNVMNGVTFAELRRIVDETAALPHVAPSAEIQIYDTLDWAENKRWYTRFRAAQNSPDFYEKLDFCRRVWGKDNVRIL
jgi:hypothetical protein